MKRCLKCSTVFDRAEWECPQCGWKPVRRNGRIHFAPEISGANESYDPAWYPALASLDAENFWFRGRNRAIGWAPHRYRARTANYLEIGCGTGYVLQMLQREFPTWNTTTTEAHAEGLEFAASRVEDSATCCQADVRALRFRGDFHVIGAFDVIEHIKQDEVVPPEIQMTLSAPGVRVLARATTHVSSERVPRAGLFPPLLRAWFTAELRDKENLPFALRWNPLSIGVSGRTHSTFGTHG